MALEDTATTETPVSATDTAAPAPNTVDATKQADGTLKVVVEQTPAPSLAEQRERDDAAKRKAQDEAFERAMKRSQAKEGKTEDPAVKEAADRAEAGAKRGPDGKFVSTDPDKAEAKAADAKPGHNNPPEAVDPEGKEKSVKSKDQPETKAEEPAKPAIPAPTSWSKEMKAKWDKLEPEVQTYLSTQDKEVARNFTRYGQAVKAAEPLMRAAEEFRDTFRGWKLSPDQALRTVMQREIALDRDPVNTILHLAKEKGVDLSHYVASNIDPDLLPPDPRIKAYETQVATLQRQLQQIQNQHAADLEDIKAYFENQERAVGQERQTAVAHELTSFAKDKPDFAKYEAQIAELIGPLRTANPKLTGKQALEEAYELAKWRDPEHRERLLEDERKKATAAREAEAAKRASSINVQGSPLTNGALSLRQVQDAAFERALRRSQSNPR